MQRGDRAADLRGGAGAAERGDTGAQTDFLYYVQRAYLRNNPDEQRALSEIEAAAGVHRFDEPHSLDISAQVIDLQAIDPSCLDPRLQMPGLEALANSKALIVNVDYPLGFAAYHLLAQIASASTDLLGVYVAGKAATLNGRVGDVMIPNVVYDEHSRNTFLFKTASWPSTSPRICSTAPCSTTRRRSRYAARSCKIGIS